MDKEYVAELIKKAIAFGYGKACLDLENGNDIYVEDAGDEYFNEFINENEL